MHRHQRRGRGLHDRRVRVIGMAATINNYTTKNLRADVMDGGVQKVMMNATIRPGKYLQLQVEILDETYAADNKDALQEAVSTFIASARDTAAENGLPT